MNRENRRKQARKLKQTIIRLPKIDFPSLQNTGKKVDKCYANRLLTCDGLISREHFISETILEKLGTIPAKGIPCLSNVEGNLTPSSLVTKCLCRTHNSFLSPLDTLAGEVFDQLIRFGTEDHPEKIIISGRYLELWMLKLLIGMICTNKITHDGINFSSADIPLQWITWLFIDRRLPEGLGLYIYHRVGERVQIESRVTAAPAFLNGTILGIRIELCGYRLLLAMLPKEQAFKSDHPDLQNILYRPKAINMNPFPQEIHFEWT